MISIYRANTKVNELNPLIQEQLRRDIIYFYHEMLQWGTISCQVDFGQTYSLSYWNYLDLRSTESNRDLRLLRHGSLLIILSMCLEPFDPSGIVFIFRNDNFKNINSSITDFIPTNKFEIEIKELIQKILSSNYDNLEELPIGTKDILLRAFITEAYGYFRNLYVNFESYLETLYLKYSKY